MKKDKALQQLNITVVALVAVVAIVGITAIVLNEEPLEEPEAPTGYAASAQPSFPSVERDGAVAVDPLI